MVSKCVLFSLRWTFVRIFNLVQPGYKHLAKPEKWLVDSPYVPVNLTPVIRISS